MDQSWRAFVAYLDGTVAEVLWRQGCVAHATDTHGGVAWSLAAAPLSALKPGYSHQLAAACDDGSLRLLGVEGGEPGLVMERVVARLAGRLLTVAWHNGASALVTAGTSGSIHVVDAVAGGRA